MNRTTSPEAFEAVLRSWLEESAGAGTPAYVDETLDRLHGLDQRRDWLVRRGLVPTLWTTPPVQVRLLVAAVLVLALIVAAMVGFGSPRPLPAPFGPNGGGVILFDTDGDIRIANADGSAQRAITSTPEQEFGAIWSPLGDRIAYWSAPAADGRLASLWTVAPDGTRPRPVTPGITFDVDPAFPAASWAPDGGRMAFATADGHLWVAAVDGTDLHEIGGTSVRRLDPAWSPAGDLIAFFGDGDAGVYVIRPDGSGETKVSSGTAVPISFRLPGWSPDGRRLVYHIEPTVDQGDIAVATLGEAGWAQSILIAGPTSDAWPRFSDDGRQLVFLRSTPEYAEGTAWIAAADGGSPRQVATDLLGWAPVCLSPDGMSVLGVGGEAGVPIGTEARPRVLVLHLARDSPTATIAVPGRLSFAACSWQRPAP